MSAVARLAAPVVRRRVRYRRSSCRAAVWSGRQFMTHFGHWNPSDNDLSSETCFGYDGRALVTVVYVIFALTLYLLPPRVL